MSILDAVILGLVQGLTEFLPVSSSGHLVMAQQILGVHEPGVFLEVVLHVGTLLSVIIVYRAKLWELVVGLFTGRGRDLRYIALLALATLPAAVVGVLLESSIESAFDAPAFAGAMLLVTGVVLWTTRFVEKDRPGGTTEPGWLLALLIGCAQAFAILPGISRSGSTITAGLWGGMLGAAAAEFSFLMSIPAIAGAAVLQVGDVRADIGVIGAVPLAVGFLTSLIAGVVAIKFLVWMLRRQEFHRFAYYLWAVGLAYLGWIWLG